MPDTNPDGSVFSDTLVLRAREAAEQYSLLSQNHDPGFWDCLREAFASGYMRGYRACEKGPVSKAPEDCSCGGHR